MTELFNGANMQMTDGWYGALALLPIIWSLYRKIIGRPVTLWILGIAVVLGVLVTGVAIWDVVRVHHMLKTGEGLHVTHGIITNSWSITSRQRDFTKTSLVYRTTISEGFNVGNERFSWTVGGGYTGATFSNLGSPRIQFVKGSEIKVTWFADESENGTRRIVKLAAAPPVQATSLVHPKPASAPHPAKQVRTATFAQFQAQFASAIQFGNQEAVKSLTTLPFLFGGNQIEAGRFGDLWNALLTPQTTKCLAQVDAIPETDGSRSIFCGEIIFVFRRNSAGNWRFAEIGADD